MELLMVFIKNKFDNIIINHVKKYAREYILVVLIFIIGLLVGVVFVNNGQEEKISNYILEFLQKFQSAQTLDINFLFKESITNNLILAFFLWFAGTTIIGMPGVLGLIFYRGLCLGYTISAITLSLGIVKGVLFCVCGLFLQNILFIPAILTIGVSSLNLYKAIVKDIRKENIKLEIVRHTLISFFMIGILALSSFIESKISINLLKIIVK